MVETSAYSKTVQLPSRGQLYDVETNEGSVEIRPWTVEEIQALASGNSRAVERVTKMVSQCATLPQGLSHGDLLTMDRFYLLLAIRWITHGGEYNYQYTCEECRSKQTDTINIVEDFEERTPDDVVETMKQKGHENFIFEEPFKLTLPQSGHEVECRLLRASDEDFIAKRSQRSQRKDASQRTMLYRMACQLVTVDGDEFPMTRKEDFLGKLTAYDGAAFENFLTRVEPGVDTTVYPVCNSCGAENEQQLPMSAEFFRPQST